MSVSKPLFVFFGTPLFSVRVLDALEAHGLLPALVVTAPDKPRGRGQKLSPSPAKAWAEARGIEYLTPATLKEMPPELLNTEWDCFCVAAYAKLLPKAVLEIPRKGCLNVHPSLLPRGRGPSPALSAILADERTSGVSIMLMDEKMDAGPILAQARIEIPEEDWPPKGSVYENLLATEGGNLLAETIAPWIAGEITPEPQDETRATFTRKFTDEDACLDREPDAHKKLLKIKAFDKNPRAYFMHNEKRIIVTEAENDNGRPRILRVIPEGKKEIDYADFLRGGATSR